MFAKRISYIVKPKYEVVVALRIPVPEMAGASATATNVRLADGTLDIATGYLWDGPSGPTVDTYEFIRGSCAHDALCDCVRAGTLPQNRLVDTHRVLRRLCIEDGMPKWLAWLVFIAVTIAGPFAVRKGMWRKWQRREGIDV